MKAYVVDDQRAIVELLSYLLGDMGIEVSGTTDPHRVVNDVVATRPDVVFLDLMMPELDGIAVLDALRQDRRTAGVPIIICTAAVLTPSQSSRITDEGIGILSKPFDVEQLEDVVDSVRAKAGLA